MKRSERYAQIKALRDRGLLLREISERCGVSISLVSDILNDPHGTAVATRKAKNNGTCVECGTETKAGGSKTPPERCAECAPQVIALRRRSSEARTGRALRWTDDQIIAALRCLAVDGRLTCGAYDEALAKAPRGTLPSRMTVIKRLGSWASACELADLKAVRRAPYASRFTAAECVGWLARCARELGVDYPSISAYEQWYHSTPGAPSAGCVRVRCGTWMAALDRLDVSGVAA
jgi:hypothetical protein